STPPRRPPRRAGTRRRSPCGTASWRGRWRCAYCRRSRSARPRSLRRRAARALRGIRGRAPCTTRSSRWAASPSRAAARRRRRPGARGDPVLAEEMLDRRQPVAHADEVAEKVVAVLAEGGLQHVLAVAAGLLEAAVPQARGVLVEVLVVRRVVEEHRHLHFLAEHVEHL